MEYKKDPLPPASGLPAEDNYTIQVWDREDGEFLGFALKTSMNGIVRSAWMEAVAKYPGCYLVETNGVYALKGAATPTGKQDETGWIDGGEVRLDELPQWYGLIARCKCGNMAYLDRYGPKLGKWRGYSLKWIAGKLTCTECTKAGRAKKSVELGLYKLPR